MSSIMFSAVFCDMFSLSFARRWDLCINLKKSVWILRIGRKQFLNKKWLSISTLLEHFLTLPIHYLADLLYQYLLVRYQLEHSKISFISLLLTWSPRIMIICRHATHKHVTQLVTAIYVQGLSLWILNLQWCTMAQLNCLLAC